jgi:FkbM family methyltransferase
MKLVLYSEYFFPVSGGVQTNIFELACGLSEWHHDHPNCDPVNVTVVTRTAQSTPDDDSWPFHLVRRPKFGRLLQLLWTADVIHLAGPVLLPMAIGVALRKPVVIEHHGYQSVCPNGLLLMGTDRAICPGHYVAGHYLQCVRCNSGDIGWFGSFRALVLQFSRSWLSKRVSSNIAITEHVARRLTLPRTQTILYGIRDPGSVQRSQNANEIEIGYVGRFVQEKGLPVLLKAAKRLHEDGLSFRLTFVGDGPLRGQLEDEALELGLADHVMFTGELTGAGLEQAVRPLQVVVMPSLWEETAGLAAIEQMMRGGVVIASDIGGLSEIVENPALKFPPGDSETLYIRLRELLKTPSLMAPIGSLARARAETVFNLRTMIQAHVSLYTKVASMKSSKGQDLTRAGKMIAAIAKRVPLGMKIALRGKRSSPRWAAAAIHNFLNRVPSNRYPVLTCAGPLKGYRMKLDWNKHRSFAYGSWEPEAVDAISRLVRPGMTVMDIGAHGGFYVLLLSKLVGSNGKVIAFEPLPANFRVLKENVAINALQNVVTEPFAVSDHSGELALEVPGPESSLLAGPVEEMDGHGTAYVRSVSLNDYFGREPVRLDFIKIDVEGAESDVLTGARQLLDRHHPSMMIELHGVGRPEEHPVAVYLQQAGYTIDWIGDVSFTAHILARWTRESGGVRS